MKFVLFQEDRSPAFFASKKGHTQTLALLLENNADVNSQDQVFKSEHSHMLMH
jgi:hypothetical protein